MLGQETAGIATPVRNDQFPPRERVWRGLGGVLCWKSSKCISLSVDEWIKFLGAEVDCGILHPCKGVFYRNRGCNSRRLEV